jgi:hypothetical protein
MPEWSDYMLVTYRFVSLKIIINIILLASSSYDEAFPYLPCIPSVAIN